MRRGELRVDLQGLAEQPLRLGLILRTRPGEVLETPSDVGVGVQCLLLAGGGAERGAGGSNNKKKEQEWDEDWSGVDAAQLFPFEEPLNRERKRKRSCPASRFTAWPRGRNAKTGSLR